VRSVELKKAWLPVFFAFIFAIAAATFASGTVGAVESESISLSPAKPKQGQTLEVKIAVSDNDSAPAISFLGKTYKTFPMSSASDNDNQGTIYRALIGVPADQKPGNYKLTVDEVSKTVPVIAGTFGVQRLRLPKGKDNFISSPGEEETVNAAKETVSSDQMWKGKFLPPSRARVSSQFGLRRIVNGVLLKDYFHSGVDYAGGLNGPVKATQRGKVIIAKHGWRLHGNTIALDHGQGVVSFYIHLNKILVKEGQVVEAGQDIGKIGSTGRASGPHLHFSLYVNRAATNPFDWYAKAY
jgi:murein DD-endopeptidase MepM/ murein hydrolase activator NlpD